MSHNLSSIRGEETFISFHGPADEIEVTPEMAAAGAAVLWEWEASDDSRADAAAERVFRQMLAAAPRHLRAPIT